MIECIWRADWEGNWETGCGEMYIILEGTPEENKMRFCVYCGKPLKQILFATNKCGLCGEPMPVGEEMFKYHGYSCPCPKLPLSEVTQEDDDRPIYNQAMDVIEELKAEIAALKDLLQIDYDYWSDRVNEAESEERKQAVNEAMRRFSDICNMLDSVATGDEKAWDVCVRLVEGNTSLQEQVAALKHRLAITEPHPFGDGYDAIDLLNDRNAALQAEANKNMEELCGLRGRVKAIEAALRE